MSDSERHLTREELLLFIDGEMNGDAAARAKKHLEGCADCSEMRVEVEMTLKQVGDIYRAEEVQGGNEDEQRTMLQMRLRRESKGSRMLWGRSAMLQPISYAAAAILIAALSIGLAHYRSIQHLSDFVEDRPVPNPDLTPGAVRQVKLEDICPAKDDDKDPSVPVEVQRAVFKEYGVEQNARAREFQIDYLINPQLGGTAEMRNLWPQPYESTVWNAHAKDILEDRLHAMVCRREIELPEAQREIATDWIGAYQKYFHTQSPLREEADLRMK